MLWFSVGRKDDFDNCTDFEEVNTTATRFAPNAGYRDWETDRKSTRLNSSHITRSRMPSSS